jgi:hypothetical protein
MGRKRKSKKTTVLNVVNPITNEVVDEIKEGDRILRNSSRKLLSETTALNVNEDFIKVFVKPLVKLSTMISNVEAWTVTYLLQYLDYTSGVLKYTNGKPLTIDDVMDEMDLKLSYAYSILRRLTEKGIIGKCKIEEKTYFVMNPFIFMKGARVSNTLVDLFKSTQWSKTFGEINIKENKGG